MLSDKIMFKSNRVMEDKPSLWYNLKHPDKVGLAAATLKILNQLNSRGWNE